MPISAQDKTSKYDFTNSLHLTVSEAASLLKVSPTTLRRFENEHKISSTRLPNGYRVFDIKDINNLKNSLETQKLSKEKNKGKKVLKTINRNIDALNKYTVQTQTQKKPINKSIRNKYLLSNAIVLVMGVYAILTFSINKNIPTTGLTSLVISTSNKALSTTNDNLITNKITDTQVSNVLALGDQRPDYSFNTSVNANFEKLLNVTGISNLNGGITTPTITFTETGTINQLDAIDDTTETTLENALDINGDVVGTGLNNTQIADSVIEGTNLVEDFEYTGNFNFAGTWLIDGSEVTATAEQINLFADISATSDEINYLSGATVDNGGLVFGNGSSFAQDPINLFWDDTNNRLGIGNTTPAYTLDVTGDIRVSSASDIYVGAKGLNDTGATAADSGATLVGVFDEFNNSNSTTVQAVLNDLDAAVSAGGSEWTQDTGFIYLTNTSDEVVIGGNASLSSKFAINGDADETQLLVQGHSTQTNNLAVFENSLGTDVFTINNSGNVTLSGTLTLNSETISDFTGDGLSLSGGALTIDLTSPTDALSSTTSSGSGLEVITTGLTLLQGCNNGEILKWNETNDSWECGTDTGASFAIVDVQNNDVSVGSNVDTIDFSTDFSVTASPSNEANVAIADDVLNFTEIADALSLDAATTITNALAGNLTIDLTSTGDFVIADGGSAVYTFTDAGGLTQAGTGQNTFTGNIDATLGIDVTNANLTVGGSNFSVDFSNGNTTTAGTLAVNGDSITSDGTTLAINAAGNVDIQDILNVDSLTTDTGGITITSGQDLTIGAIGLNDLGTNNATSGASLVGTYDEFNNSNSTTVQDVLDDLDAAIGAGASKWTQDTGFAYLTNTTDSITIGGNTELGKLAVDGNADEVQLLIQGNGTQTNNLAVFENSAGVDQFTVTNTGDLTIAGDLAISGGNITTAVTFDSTATSTGTLTANGTFDANGVVTLGDGSDNIAIDGNIWDITSAGVGTGFTSFTIDNVIVDGTTIGHTSDTDLLSLANGALTVNGTGTFTGVLATNATTLGLDADADTDNYFTVGASGTAGDASNDLFWGQDLLCDVSATNCGWATAASAFSSWTIADNDGSSYAIVDSNTIRFTTSDGNVITNLTNGDDADENLDLTVRLLGDIVAGAGLTGGADNILVGADADTTITIGAGNGITVNADDVAVNQDYDFTFTGNNTFTPAGTDDLTINLDDDSLLSINQTFSGTTTANGLTQTITNSSTSGTQNAFYLDNAASTGVTDSLFVIDNSDTDTAVTNAIQFVDAGGGFTNLFNVAGTLISPAEFTILDGGINLASSSEVTGILPLANGGTGANLVDPNADRIFFWDDTAGASTWLAADGTSIEIAGTTLQHVDTSTQASVNNSTTTVIQDITLDTYGHLTGITSVDLASSFDNYGQWYYALDFTSPLPITSGQTLTYMSGNDIDITNSGTRQITVALESTLDIVSTINLAGTGTLNGLDAVDATTENTIEGLIFDNDAENITGVWEVQDDTNFVFGNDANVRFAYNEIYDLFEISTPSIAAQNTDYALYTLSTDNTNAGMTADQEVFEIGKGGSFNADMNYVELLALDEDGDLSVTGTGTFNGVLATNATTLGLDADADTDNYFTIGATGTAGDASNDLFFGQDLLCDVSATNCGWATAASSFTSFTLAGDAGGGQTISSTDTLSVLGGTNGIDTIDSATDTVTLNLDTTEIGTTTFGSGSAFAWTFNAGTTDPVIGFGDDQLDLGSATTGLRLTTDGILSDIDDANVSINDGLQFVGAQTISTSSGNLTIDTAGTFIISDAVDLNNTLDLDISSASAFTVGDGSINTFSIDTANDLIASTGNYVATFTSLVTNTLANGAGSSSTSLTVDDSTGFDVGNYVRIDSASNCDSGITTCYSKIRQIVGNVITLRNALTWTDNSTITEYHIPEIGGTNTAEALTDRFGRGYFISGTVAGNASTYYDDRRIYTTDTTSSNSPSFTISTGTTTTSGNSGDITIDTGVAAGTEGQIYLGNTNASAITIGHAGVTTTIGGSIIINSQEFANLTGQGLALDGSNVLNFDCSEVEGTDIDCSGENITLESTIDSISTLNLAGTGTLNGLDAVDATSENTIEALIFDNDAETITGVWEVQDDVNFAFGTAANINFVYNQTDDLFNINATSTASQNTDYGLYTLSTDNANAGMTADQEVFEIGKGGNDDSDTNYIELLALDEDGDLSVTGTGTFTGSLATNATAIGLNNDADTDNVLSFGAGSAGAASGNLYWGNVLVCDASQANCGWVTSSGSGASKWTDGGDHIYPTGGEFLGDDTSNGANKLAGAYFLDGAPLVLGTTNDIQFAYDETTDDQLEISDGTNDFLTIKDNGTTATFTFDNIVQIGSDGQDGQFVLYNELGATDYTNTFALSGTQSQDITYTLPANDGGASQVLSTNGSGVLTWIDVSGGAGGYTGWAIADDDNDTYTISSGDQIKLYSSSNVITTNLINGDDTLDEIDLDIADDSLNFTEFADSLSVDATTDINLGTSNLTVDLDSTGIFDIRDGATTYWSFDDDSTVDVTFPAAGSLTIDSATTDSTLTTGIFDLNVDTITTGNIGFNIDHIIRDSAGITAYGQRINTTIDTDAAESSTGYGLYISGTNNDASSTLTGLYVDAGTGAGTEYAAAFMNGNVGIGIATPESKLHINNADTAANGLRLSYSEASYDDQYSLDLYSAGGSGAFIDAATTTNGLTIRTSSNATRTNLAARMVILGGANAGNVGLSTTAPDARLEINHATGDNLRLTYNDADGTASNYTDFSLASDGDLTIDSAGGAINLASGDDLNITASTDLIFGTTTSLGESTGATDSGAYLVGVFDEFNSSNGTNVQDVLDDLDAAVGAGASKWTQDTGFIYLTGSTDSVTIGGTTELGKLAVDGDADQIQLLIQGNATQTSNLAVFENSAGADQLVVTNTGDLTIAGDATITGNLLTFGNGETIDNNADGTIALNPTVLTLTGTTTLNGTSLTAINGGATAIDFTEFDVAAATGSVTINDGGDLGSLTVEGTVLDINSLDFVGTGAINTTDWDISSTGDLTGIGGITADGAISFTPSSTNDITFGVDTDSLFTLDSSVANADNFTFSPNNAGTGATFTGTLTSANLTADRTWTLKDADGTIAFLTDIPTSDNYQYWTLDGDDADTEQIGSTNTLLVAGGTNGIDTDVSATDTITLNLDTTEIGTTTFGSGSGITWTFDASAGTDTAVAFGDNLQTLTTATLTLSGTTTLNGTSLTAINGGATAIDFTEFDVAAATGSVTINDGGDLGSLTVEGTALDINSLDFAGVGSITTGGSTDLTLNPSGGNVIVTDGDVLDVYGTTIGLNNDADTDNVFGLSASAGSAGSDIYWGDDLLCDVSEANCGWTTAASSFTGFSISDGSTTEGIASADTITFADSSTINAAVSATDTVTMNVIANSLDFAHLEDTLDLDATTEINLGANNLVIDLDSTGDFVINDGGITFATFMDNGRLGLGTSQDLQLYHDGSDGYISGSTGGIIVNSSAGNVILGSNSGSWVGVGDVSPDAQFDVDYISTNTTAGTELGSYFTMADTGIVTTGSDITIGIENDVTRTGATGGALVTYGIQNNITADNAGSGSSTAYAYYASFGGLADFSYAFFADDGDIELQEDGTGVVGAGGNLLLGASEDFKLYHNGSDSFMLGTENDLYIGADSGTANSQIKFGNEGASTVYGYFITGSSNTGDFVVDTNTLYLDASADSLGIGTTAPDARLEINHATGDNLRLTYNDADGSATSYTDFSLASDGDLTIDSAGNNIAFGAADIITALANINADGGLDIDDAFVIADGGVLTTSQTANFDGAADFDGNVLISDTDIAFDGASTTFTTTGAFTLTPGGAVLLGDGGDTLQINTSDWDISTTGDLTGIGGITADGAISFTPSSTNDITFNVDTDSLFTLDSSVTNGDNLVFSPNNAGTGSTFTGTLTSANLTADRTWTLQDGDGTIAFLTDIPTSDNYQYWTLDGDDADTEQIGSTNTLLVAGGTNGIDTDVSATDTITLNLDTTEIGTTTFGSGSSIAWTFNAGTTDPVLTFGDNSLTIGSAATVTATDVTTFNCTDCLNFDDLSDALTLDAATTITNSTAGDLSFDLTSTGVLNIKDSTVTYWSFDDDSTVDVTFPAAGQLAIDAATTDSTLTTGIFDLNVDTVTSGNIGLNIDHIIRDSTGITAYGQRINTTIDTDAAESSTGYGLYINGTNNDASSTLTGLYVDAGTGAGTEYAAAFMNGNVGIGTTTPATKLSIDSNSNTQNLRLYGATEASQIADIYIGTQGNLVLSTIAGSDSAGYLDLQSESNNYGLILRESDGTGGSAFANFFVVDHATDPDYLSIVLNTTTNTNALNVTVGNNVGIGTANPAGPLEVDTSTTSGVAVTIDQDDVDQTALDFDINNTAADILNIDWGGATSQTAALTGIDLDFTNLTSVAGSTTYGLHINDLSAQTTSTEYAIYQEGTNWDYGLYIEDAALFNTSLVVNGTTIGLDYDASANNVVSLGTGPGQASGDLYWGDDLVCDVSEANCGWATAASLFTGFSISDGSTTEGIASADTITFADSSTINAAVSATDTVTMNVIANSLDFAHLEDTLDLDATTEINFGASSLSYDLNSTGTFDILDNNQKFWSFDDDSTVDVTFPAAGELNIDSATTDSTVTTGVLDLNVDTVTTGNIGLNIDHIIRDSAGITAYGQRINTTIDTDAAQSSTGYGLYISGTNNDATSTLTGLYVDAGTGAGTEYAAAFMNGNVGIGTATPLSTARLDVMGGDFRVQAAEGTNRLLLTGTGDTSGAELYIYNSTGALTSRVSGDGGGITYFNNGLGVGIGTTAPDAKLEINHATGDNLRLTYNDADGSATSYTDFSLASDGDLTIDSAGNNIAFGAADIITAFANINADGGLDIDDAFVIADGGVLTTSQTANFDGAADFDGNVLISDTDIAFDGASTTFTTTGAFTLTPGGAVLLGDGGDTLQINTSDWDISTTGDLTGIGAITANGTYTTSTGTSTAIDLTRSSAGQWMGFNDGTDVWGLYNTAGSPEGVLAANTGALAMDTTNGTLYVKTDDTDNTSWVNLATGLSSPWTDGTGISYLTDTAEDVVVGSDDADLVAPLSFDTSANLLRLGDGVSDTNDPSIAFYASDATNSGTLSFTDSDAFLFTGADINLAAGEVYQIGGTQVINLSSTATGSIFFGNGGTSVGANDDYNTGVGIGTLSGLNNSTGLRNTGLGYNALNITTFGDDNVAIGYAVLDHNTYGSANIGIGYNALTTNTDGNDNVAIGYAALDALGAGQSGNIAIGRDALGTTSLISGWNVAIGYGALDSHTNGISASGYNTAVGTGAGDKVTGGVDNTLIGSYAGAGVTTGGQNVFIGRTAGGYSASGEITGSANIGIGYEVGRTGFAFSGSNNLMIGNSTGGTITSGFDNILLGYGPGGNITTGAWNIILGSGAGGAITSASDGNIIIGRDAGDSLTSDDDFSVMIGYQAGGQETTGGKLYIENTNSTTPLIYGDFTTDELVFNGLPAGTVTASETVTIAPVFGVNAADQVLMGLNIAANTNSNTDSGDTLRGLNIANITGTAASETAFTIGTGWDTDLVFSDTSAVLSFGNTGTLTFNDGTNALMSLTDDGATATLAVTGDLDISSAGSSAVNLTRTSAGQWMNFSDGTDIWGLYNTAGSPEGVLAANTGALAMDTTNGTLYVKTDDTDNTGWTNLATGGSSPWTDGSGISYLTDAAEDIVVGSDDADLVAPLSFDTSANLLRLGDGVSDAFDPSITFYASDATNSGTLSYSDSDAFVFTGGNLTMVTGNINADGGLDIDDAFVVADGGVLTTSQTANFDGSADFDGDVLISDTNVAFDGASTTFTATGAFTINPGGAMLLGDGGDTMQINSSDWDVSTTGDLSGIGTIAMDGNLTINKADSSIIFDTTTATDTDYWMGVQDDAGSDDDDLFIIGDGTTPGSNNFVSVNTSGNVGIGTGSTAATTKLQILATTEQLRLNYDASNYTSFTVNSTGDLTIADTGTNIATFNEAQAAFAVPTSFNASGDVNIANDIQFSNQTSTFIKSNAPLTIEAGETFENNNLTLTTYGTGNIVANLGTDPTTPGGLIPGTDDLNDLGSSSYRWDDIYATNATIQTSDERLKENVVDMNYGLAQILQLRPVTYTWIGKPEKGTKLGLIAQEAINVVPEVVNVPTEGGYLGIRYTDLIPVIIKGIQEQNTTITAMQEQINDLITNQTTTGGTALEEITTLINNFTATLESLGMSSMKDVNGNDILVLAHDMNVLGASTFADVTITGDVNLGVIKIDTLNTSISTVATDEILFLQNHPLAGNLDIFNGKIVFEKDGTINTKEIAAENYIVKASGETVGSAKIEQGEDSVEINTSKVESSSKIFITATTSTNGKVLYVSDKLSGDHFTVKIDSIASQDIDFDWWIIQTE